MHALDWGDEIGHSAFIREAIPKTMKSANPKVRPEPKSLRPEVTKAMKQKQRLTARMHDQQLAFELWLGPAGRNLARAHRIASAEPYNLSVTYATFQNWKKVFTWDIQADELQARMSPALKGRFLGLAEAAAVQGMQEIVSSLHGGRLPLLAPEVQAIKLAVQAAGWLPDWKNAGAVHVQLSPSAGVGISLSASDRESLSAGIVDLLALE